MMAGRLGASYIFPVAAATPAFCLESLMAADRIDADFVRATFAGLADPETGRSAAQMGQLGEIVVDGRRVDVTLGLTTWAKPLWDETRRDAEHLLRSKLPPDAEINIRLVEHVRRPEKIGQLGLEVKSV